MIIGLVGTKGSGKSTVAKFLAEKSYFIELSFASILKEIIQSLFFLSEEQLNDQVLKEKIIPELGVSPRYLMQNIGTDMFRIQLSKCLPNLRLGNSIQSIWVWHMKKKIENLLNINPRQNIAISDVRFEDEFDLLKNEFQAKMILIKRPKIYENKDSHESESFSFLKTKEDYEKLDGTIINDDSLEYLHHVVHAVIKKFSHQ